LHKQRPKIPSETDLFLLGQASAQDLAAWTTGLMLEMQKSVDREGPAEQRGKEIVGLSPKLEEVQCESARRRLKAQGFQPGQSWCFLAVVSEDGQTEVIPEGQRTFEEHAQLYGRTVARALTFSVCAGKEDLMQVVSEALRLRKEKR
jgi:hypothetical protein